MVPPMKNVEVKFSKPPIIEAIVDIDCDLPPGQDFAGLEAPARDTFRSAYPRMRKQHVQELHVTTKTGGPLEPTVRSQRIQSFQFLTPDEKQLIQVRAQGYSFNKLSPYTTLDDYLPEIERTWTAYCAVATPLQIRTVRLRYINRILLPMTEGKCRLDDYIRAAPQLPDGGRLALTGFVTQRAAVETSTGLDVNIVLAAQKPDGDKLPVILDICVTANEPGECADLAWLLKRIVANRGLCNHIFEESVTELCLNLFQ